MFLGVLELAVATGPIVTFNTHPADTIADADSTIAFTADYDASQPGETLRWHRDGVPLTDDPRTTGSTTNTLTITAARPEDAGLYTLAVTLDGATFTSDPAIAAVRGRPADAADINGDGTFDFFDMLDFLRLHAEATP